MECTNCKLELVDKRTGQRLCLTCASETEQDAEKKLGFVEADHQKLLSEIDTFLHSDIAEERRNNNAKLVLNVSLAVTMLGLSIFYFTVYSPKAPAAKYLSATKQVELLPDYLLDGRSNLRDIEVVPVRFFRAELANIETKPDIVTLVATVPGTDSNEELLDQTIETAKSGLVNAEQALQIIEGVQAFNTAGYPQAIVSAHLEVTNHLDNTRSILEEDKKILNYFMIDAKTTKEVEKAKNDLETSLNEAETSGEARAIIQTIRGRLGDQRATLNAFDSSENLKKLRSDSVNLIAITERFLDSIDKGIQNNSQPDIQKAQEQLEDEQNANFSQTLNDLSSFWKEIAIYKNIESNISGFPNISSLRLGIYNQFELKPYTALFFLRGLDINI